MRMFRGYDLDKRRRVVLECKDPTRTQQSQKEDADINVIVKRFGITGQIPVRLDRLNLGAFEGIFDFQSAMNAVVRAERAFAAIPSAIRKRFGNDPQEFVAFASDPKNKEELQKMKLVAADPEVVPEKVQKVEIVAGLVPVPNPAATK